MENKQICHAEEFQVTYVNNLLSEERSITPTPQVQAVHSGFLPKGTVWKGRNPANTSFISRVDSMYP